MLCRGATGGGGIKDILDLCTDCTLELETLEASAKSFPAPKPSPPGNIPKAQHVDIAPQDLTSSELDVDQRICSAWPKPKPVAVAVTAKQRKWGKLKSGLFGWVKVTPQKPKKKTAISQKSPILNQGGGLNKNQNKQTTKIS